jgi:hypothetical protein
VNFWKNGSNATFVGAGEKREDGSSNWSGSGASSAVVHVQEGDYFEIRGYHLHGSNLDLVATENRSWFAIEVLG